MAIKHNNSDMISDINITPFVDVMLVLLIIFMVTAPMMTKGVNVALPEAEQASSISNKEDTLVITISKEGKIYIDDFDVTITLLSEKLKLFLDRRDKKEVFLKADKEIPYGMVVKVISEVKKAGVNKLGILTVEKGKN
jgi:biopolymer transport protein TolR